jgi:hypothetical protein
MTITSTAVAPSVPETELYDLVTKFIHEAMSGPEYSGMSQTVRADGVEIEMLASRNWGLRFSRSLSDDRTESRHLNGDDLTVERAAAAYAELLHMS